MWGYTESIITGTIYSDSAKKFKKKKQQTSFLFEASLVATE